MLTEETFKKELVRMWDDMRDSKYKGQTRCDGVDCNDCLLNEICNTEYRSTLVYGAVSITKIVEKWSKEHPAKTNMDAAKEMLEKAFGIKLSDSFIDMLSECRGINKEYNDVGCSEGKSCRDCKYLGFWEQEYKPRKTEECDQEGEK